MGPGDAQVLAGHLQGPVDGRIRFFARQEQHRDRGQDLLPLELLFPLRLEPFPLRDVADGDQQVVAVGLEMDQADQPRERDAGQGLKGPFEGAAALADRLLDHLVRQGGDGAAFRLNRRGERDGRLAQQGLGIGRFEQFHGSPVAGGKDADGRVVKNHGVPRPLEQVPVPVFAFPEGRGRGFQIGQGPLRAVALAIGVLQQGHGLLPGLLQIGGPLPDLAYQLLAAAFQEPGLRPKHAAQGDQHQQDRDKE
ncbi:MAG: hypothetical protein BWY73_01604 [candidate division TA06 bacterium ADurb.Bin417]|uniref:Uncharacterized protein n=1 Tax=candidate division TA06 bacterium ADurb.Bin417 TaxID=1852828 RepID=A0A1V5M6M5_UNCT6|nr:MAG: hypothetical protein BWY73_01604 [candidate division TA06 bacterium ADurb.Bin417]